jgi:hypothetical protein
LVAVTNALGVPVIWQVSENAVTLNPAGKVGLDEQLVTEPPLLVKISVVAE